MQARPPDRSFRALLLGWSLVPPVGHLPRRWSRGSQSRVSPQAASASPENMCKMQVMPPPPRELPNRTPAKGPLAPGDPDARIGWRTSALFGGSSAGFLPSSLGPRCAEGTAQALVKRVSCWSQPQTFPECSPAAGRRLCTGPFSRTPRGQGCGPDCM